MPISMPTGVDFKSSVCVKNCNIKLTPQEEECCMNAVSMSPHTKIVVLPNHGLNADGEMQGFMFLAHRDDKAAVLPVNKRMCETTSIYECKTDWTDSGEFTAFNAKVLHIINNIDTYRTSMQEYIDCLNRSELDEVHFDCIPDRETVTTDLQNQDVLDLHLTQACDAREWRESVPNKVGLYQAYSSTSDNPFREHKLFIIVSGHLPHACEELHNLWLDCKESVSCYDFVHSEELNFLRRATQRNHNRIAADLADIFELNVERIRDSDYPSERYMVLPTTSTIQSDVIYCPQKQRIKMTDDACLPECSNNGVVFEMYSCEGFWLFHGPRDNSTYNPYGGEFYSTSEESCFPTRTRLLQGIFSDLSGPDVITIPRESNIVINFSEDAYTAHDTRKELDEDGNPITRTNKFMRLSENFMRVLQKLGFNRNDGITNLMPLVCYVQNE